MPSDGRRALRRESGSRQVASEAPLPAIVHWDQNHFVVVYRVKKHRRGTYAVFVADPGKGLVTYTKLRMSFAGTG